LWTKSPKERGKKKMTWKELTDEQKRDCYESYVSDIIYEHGDYAHYLSFEEWCKESEMFGWPLCDSI
jgi:hypothetical protein